VEQEHQKNIENQIVIDCTKGADQAKTRCDEERGNKAIEAAAQHNATATTEVTSNGAPLVGEDVTNPHDLNEILENDQASAAAAEAADLEQDSKMANVYQAKKSDNT